MAYWQSSWSNGHLPGTSSNSINQYATVRKSERAKSVIYLLLNVVQATVCLPARIKCRLFLTVCYMASGGMCRVRIQQIIWRLK